MTRPAELRRALEGALAENIVPATLTATLEATMAVLREATIALAFEAPPVTATGSLGDLLATVLPTRAIQEELLDVYLTHTGTLEEFWDDLGREPRSRRRALLPISSSRSSSAPSRVSTFRC